MSQTATSISRKTKTICILSSSCGQRHLRRIRRSVLRVKDVCTATTPAQVVIRSQYATDTSRLDRNLCLAKTLITMARLIVHRSSCSSSEVSWPLFDLYAQSPAEKVGFGSGTPRNIRHVCNALGERAVFVDFMRICRLSNTIVRRRLFELT